MTYLLGLWRLRFGWCPACNSSPPLWHCQVCEGSYAYGPALSDAKRAQWRVRWKRVCA